MGEPDDVVQAMVDNFDHHHPEFAQQDLPQRVYAEMRENCPVKWTGAQGGFWVTSKYRDIDRVANDPQTFSSALGNLVPHGPDALPERERAALLEGGRGSAPPVFYDPPLHSAYRRALNPLFTPKAVRVREDYIRSVTDELIDSFIDSGSCEIVGAFCAPVPAIVVLDWLGLPTNGWKQWSDAVLAQFENPGQSGPDSSKIDLPAVLAEVQDRRKNPREDVLTALSQTEVDGARLSDRELLQIVAVIIFAGLDTTTNAVASSLVELQRHPDLRAELAHTPIDDPLWGNAIEELLRYVCPVQGFRRTARAQAQVGDATINPGERVFMLWASGNFDEDIFDDPTRLDLHRNNNRHMSFGRGIHRCLGAHLARLEMTVMLQQILHRIPEYEIDEGALQLHPDVGLVYGFGSVPMRFRAPAAAK
ncbi:MAG: cytochrome P450 [Mycobacterium sp.]